MIFCQSGINYLIVTPFWCRIHQIHLYTKIHELLNTIKNIAFLSVIWLWMRNGIGSPLFKCMQQLCFWFIYEFFTFTYILLPCSQFFYIVLVFLFSLLSFTLFTLYNFLCYDLPGLLMGWTTKVMYAVTGMQVFVNWSSDIGWILIRFIKVVWKAANSSWQMPGVYAC